MCVMNQGTHARVMNQGTHAYVMNQGTHAYVMNQGNYVGGIVKYLKQFFLKLPAIFFKIFIGHMSILGPLIPLFWTSGDVSSGF